MEDYDRVFFMGDLNPRVEMSRADADAWLACASISELLAKDQLTPLLNGGGAGPWSAFDEMKIQFEPTYKFDAGTDCYDSSKKQRVPSWTDRILWKRDSSIRGLKYDSVRSLKLSDHKPVIAQFEVLVDLDRWDGPKTHQASGVCALQ